jgi:hypothetical protein
LGAAALAFAAAGCGSGSDGSSSAGAHDTTAAAVNLHGKHVKLSTKDTAKGERRVKLKVVTAPDRSTIALVPVYINGVGPFAFAVDTGASKSLVDLRVVRQLGIKTLGSAGRVRGVAGTATGQRVRISRWRAGSVGLPGVTIASLHLTRPDGKGLDGLLGSDVLSRYGKIALDYDHDVLLLDPKVR